MKYWYITFSDGKDGLMEGITACNALASVKRNRMGVCSIVYCMEVSENSARELFITVQFNFTSITLDSSTK